MTGRRWVWILFAAAIAIRIAAGLPRGEARSLHDGYEFYATISENFLAGHGFCYSADGGCAARMPVYPLWLAPFVATGTLYPGVIITQAAVGATLVWIAWALGLQLFDARAAMLAAIAAAFSPYAIIHDTAMQDTVFVNVLMPVAMLCLMRARASRSALLWLAAGAALAAAVLTNARIALFVPCAIAWTIIAVRGEWRERVRAAAIVSVPLVILVGGWMLRNWHVAGAPVLTTEAGERLWFANNPRTFANFPERSIDLTADELMAIVPPDAREMLDHFPGSELDRDNYVRRRAIDYMAQDPRRTAANAFRKMWVAAAAQLSPARGPIVQAGYTLVFLPIHALAIVMLWRARARSVDHLLTMLLLLSFAITTAAFWAHTSHKSYLDAVLFVYAAAAVVSFVPTRPPAGAPV